MIGPGLIKTTDTYLAFPGSEVLEVNTGSPLADIDDSGHSVSITVYNITQGTFDTAESVTMNYNSDVDVWLLEWVTDAVTKLDLKDRERYIARVVDDESAPAVLFRPFQVEEFAIDNEIVERGVFDMVTDGTANSKITWYSDNFTTPVFEAPLYEGGVGSSNYATSPEKVTHRGAIVEVSP